jgi:hypothetical protein
VASWFYRTFDALLDKIVLFSYIQKLDVEDLQSKRKKVQ